MRRTRKLWCVQRYGTFMGNLQHRRTGVWEPIPQHRGSRHLRRRVLCRRMSPERNDFEDVQDMSDEEAREEVDPLLRDQN